MTQNHIKYIFATILSISSFAKIEAQKKLPILKANSSKALFVEEDNGLKTDWNIDPSLKPDVYVVSKISTDFKVVKIKTDIDSIKIKVKKGEKKDFIILLKGKDSCLTRIESLPPKDFSKNVPAFHDTIKISINEHNTMSTKAALNKKDSLILNFDTGSSELLLTNETLKDKIKQSLKTGINILSLGKKDYQGFKIYATELVGHGSDGIFGWSFFDGTITEINYDQNIMVIHSKLPEYVLKDKSYSKLNLKYFNNVFLVETTIQQGKTKNTDWYLFDTGYQRTAMLDGPMLKEQNFPINELKEIKKVIVKGAEGNEISVITSNLESLQLGKYTLKNIPAQVLPQSRLVGGSRMNILGNEILKRFNVFLDFQNNVVYIKPNKLFNEEYIEKKE